MRDELGHDGEDGVSDELEGEGAEELHKEHVGGAAHPDGDLMTFQRNLT